jgi:hypothetical protein
VISNPNDGDCHDRLPHRFVVQVSLLMRGSCLLREVV